MNCITNYTKPQFVIKYDYISRSINAYFSFHNLNDLSFLEKEAINMISERFKIIANRYIYKPVHKLSLKTFSGEISSLLYSIQQEIGVEILLNDNSLRDYYGFSII